MARGEQLQYLPSRKKKRFYKKVWRRWQRRLRKVSELIHNVRRYNGWSD